MQMIMASLICYLSLVRLDCFCENIEQFVLDMMELCKNFPILCSACAYIQDN